VQRVPLFEVGLHQSRPCSPRQTLTLNTEAALAG
jgi:hypothetical protein